MMFGRLGAMRVLGLPGNPVSSLICARAVHGAADRTAELDAARTSQTTEAIAAVDLEANGPRAHYMRATLTRSADGALSVTPVRSQDSSLLSPLAAADCLLVRPVGAPAPRPATPVPVLPLDF